MPATLPQFRSLPMITMADLSARSTCCDQGSRPGRQGHCEEAVLRAAAHVRLPVHRPARLHGQRRRFTVRPGPPPVACRRRERRRDAPDRRAGPRHRAGLVARRHEDRIRLRTATRPTTSLPTGHPCRRCRVARVTAVTAGPRSIFGAPVWMPDGRTIAALGHRARRARRQPERHLALPGGRVRGPRRRAVGTCRARHDLMPGSGMNSDIDRGETARLWPVEGRRCSLPGARSTAPTSSGGSPSATARSGG